MGIAFIKEAKRGTLNIPTNFIQEAEAHTL